MKQIAVLVLVPFLLQIFPAPQAPREFATLEGRVIDAITGRPLPGVTVTSRMPQSGSVPAVVGDRVQLDSLDRPVVQVLTDNEGRFSVRVVAGRATVVFGKDLYGVRTLTYTVASGQQFQDAVVRLVPAGVISGRVVDSRSNPVQSARVRPMQSRFLGRGEEFVYLPNTTTNDRGEFRLPNLQPGIYLLSLSTPVSGALYPGVQELSQAERVSVEAGTETRLKDVVLLTGSIQKGTIQVRLINGSGEGPKDVAYVFTNATPNFEAPGLDGNSFFQVSEGSKTPPVIHLEPSAMSTSTHNVSALGTYRATVTWKDANGLTARSTVDMEFNGANVVKDLIIRTPDARLSCRAVIEEPDGRIVPLLQLNVMVRGSASQAGCLTRQDGTQAIAPLHAGKYYLYGFQGIPADAYVESVTVNGQNALDGDFELTNTASVLDVRVRRDAGVIRGKVTDNQGRVVHDALVAAVPDSPAQRKLGFPTSRTDQNGVFEIRGLRPGSYGLYSWSALDESALRDPELLRKFEGRGSEVQVSERAAVASDLKVLDDAR